MNEDIIVLDDFLPPYLQDTLEAICKKVDYEFVEYPTFSPSKLGEKREEIERIFNETIQFCHIFWDTRTLGRLRDGTINYSKLEELGHYFLLPLQIACGKMGIVFSLKENLIRGKINSTFRGENNKPNTQFPHRDMNKYSTEDLRDKSYSIIYYINESEGDTIIYNELEYLPLDKMQNYTVREKISPKKGRIVFMKGHLIHSASNPPFLSKHYNRFVINYNLMF